MSIITIFKKKREKKKEKRKKKKKEKGKKKKERKTCSNPTGMGSKNVQESADGVRIFFDIPMSWQGERVLVVMVRGVVRRVGGSRV